MSITTAAAQKDVNTRLVNYVKPCPFGCCTRQQAIARQSGPSLYISLSMGCTALCTEQAKGDLEPHQPVRTGCIPGCRVTSPAVWLSQSTYMFSKEEAMDTPRSNALLDANAAICAASQCKGCSSSRGSRVQSSQQACLGGHPSLSSAKLRVSLVSVQVLARRQVTGIPRSVTMSSSARMQPSWVTSPSARAHKWQRGRWC